ncbi:MAG: dihydrofolate reductase family protein [Phycicoccus sp.]
MRKVVVYMLTSLDGVAEEPGDWMTDVGPPIFDNLADVIRTQDTVLLGRRTYDYWVGFWPDDGPEPFRSFINDTEKHVVTSRPLEQEWANTVVVGAAVEEHVRALKQGDGGDIGVHGSVTLAHSLVNAGLVDEYRLVVSGTVAGHGSRLFDDVERPHRLALVEAVATPGGSLLLTYRGTDASGDGRR